MSTRVKSAKFWDLLAKNYDRDEGNPSDRQDILLTKKYLQPGDTVMDYACGTGTLSVEITALVKEVNAVDISSKMLAAARSKAAQRKFENIVFSQATLFDDKFKPESFQVILGFNILHLLANVPQALGRINALLMPGGLFISNNPCLEEQQVFSNRMFYSLLQALSKIGIIPHVKLLRSSELDSLLTQGNFQVLETKKFANGAFGTTDYFIVARKIS